MDSFAALPGRRIRGDRGCVARCRFRTFRFAHHQYQAHRPARGIQWRAPISSQSVRPCSPFTSCGAAAKCSTPLAQISLIVVHVTGTVISILPLPSQVSHSSSPKHSGQFTNLVSENSPDSAPLHRSQQLTSSVPSRNHLELPEGCQPGE